MNLLAYQPSSFPFKENIVSFLDSHFVYKLI